MVENCPCCRKEGVDLKLLDGDARNLSHITEIEVIPASLMIHFLLLAWRFSFLCWITSDRLMMVGNCWGSCQEVRVEMGGLREEVSAWSLNSPTIKLAPSSSVTSPSFALRSPYSGLPRLLNLRSSSPPSLPPGPLQPPHLPSASLPSAHTLSSLRKRGSSPSSLLSSSWSRFILIIIQHQHHERRHILQYHHIPPFQQK